MYKVKISIGAVLLGLVLWLPLDGGAQTDPDPGGVGGGIWGTTDPESADPTDDLGSTPAPGNEVPVDGGLSLLLAAGAAYGGRRLYRKKGKG